MTSRFVSHLLSSPVRDQRDIEDYSGLGRSYRVQNINKPEFVIFGKKLVFDISPKRWMFVLMRRMRFLRALLPEWHKKEGVINSRIRKELLEGIISLDSKGRSKRLRELENIKGYRSVRYKAAAKYLKDESLV